METSTIIVSVQSEIQTGHLQKRSTQCYYTNLLGNNILSIITRRRMRQVGHATCVGKIKNNYVFVITQEKRPL
jgi:hypothetical protein